MNRYTPPRAPRPRITVADAFELVGSAVFDAETGELEHCPPELDPSACAAYAARPVVPPALDARGVCPLHGDPLRYCGCDPC